LRRGFTLIELLIVVAIVAVLAALAVPNFLQAQTRSKVSAAKATMRSGATALQTYAVDNNAYPPTLSRFPADPLGILADVQLAPLSTPIAYMTASTMLRDPFGAVQLRAAVPGSGSLQPKNHFPEITPPNPNRSLLYFHYPSMSRRLDAPELNFFASSLLSLGPDRRDSAGAYVVAPPDVFSDLFSELGFDHPVDTIYDPTNGTVSEGDIPFVVGEARGVAP